MTEHPRTPDDSLLPEPTPQLSSSYTICRTRYGTEEVRIALAVGGDVQMLEKRPCWDGQDGTAGKSTNCHPDNPSSNPRDPRGPLTPIHELWHTPLTCAHTKSLDGNKGSYYFHVMSKTCWNSQQSPVHTRMCTRDMHTHKHTHSASCLAAPSYLSAANPQIYNYDLAPREVLQCYRTQFKLQKGMQAFID